MAAPIREIPLAETLFGELGKLAVASPGIQGFVVEQKVWRVLHGWPRQLRQGAVFLWMGKDVSGNLERSALC